MNWVVIRTPLAVKKEHLQALQSLKNFEFKNIKNNYRETSCSNDRPIYYHGVELLVNKTLSMGKRIGLRSVPAAVVVSLDDESFENL